MNEPEVLTAEELTKVVLDLIDQKAAGVMTHLTSGKWHVCDVFFKAVTPSAIQIEVQQNEKRIPIDIQINQPVGISVQHQFNKYIFESVVIGLESVLHGTCSGKVVLELPDKSERMQRRAYARTGAPGKLKVKVLFWHRGYLDDTTEAPLDNYWQGRLLDLSAGGMQIAVDVDQGVNFRPGQLVGLQFTPMPHQKPLLLEAQVKHLASKTDGKEFYIGVEFIGLETSGEGRQKLRRLIDIVHEYDDINQTPPGNPAQE
ncbi:MAG: PilZ domain-containing protein [Phycisphaerae bacterium]|nr:PilZ domain-containing protein [Phycisphaerae bacterium]